MVEDEVELVERCLAGDPGSLRAFVQSFQGAVFGLCLRMVGHREDAEDISQDVFLRAFRSLRRWDPKRPLRPWLLAIAANRCRTFLQQRSRRPLQTEPLIEGASVPPGCHTVELAEELQLALGTLREEQRMCLILFYHEDMSCAEIGEILGCPQGTVKTWLHRARRELADYLRRRGVVPESQYELHRV